MVRQDKRKSGRVTPKAGEVASKVRDDSDSEARKGDGEGSTKAKGRPKTKGRPGKKSTSTKSDKATSSKSGKSTSSKGRKTAATSKANRTPVRVDGPSPVIVPILMFGFWGLGALVLLANYIVQGYLGMPSNWYLLVGLLLILLGFIPATRFR